MFIESATGTRWLRTRQAEAEESLRRVQLDLARGISRTAKRLGELEKVDLLIRCLEFVRSHAPDGPEAAVRREVRRQMDRVSLMLPPDLLRSLPENVRRSAAAAEASSPESLEARSAVSTASIATDTTTAAADVPASSPNSDSQESAPSLNAPALDLPPSSSSTTTPSWTANFPPRSPFTLSENTATCVSPPLPSTTNGESTVLSPANPSLGSFSTSTSPSQTQTAATVVVEPHSNSSPSATTPESPVAADTDFSPFVGLAPVPVTFSPSAKAQILTPPSTLPSLPPIPLLAQPPTDSTSPQQEEPQVLVTEHSDVNAQ